MTQEEVKKLFQKYPESERLIAKVIQEFPKLETKILPHLSLIVIKSDVFHQGDIDKILDYLEKKGLIFLRSKIKNYFTEDECEDFYKYGKADYNEYWYLNKGVFGFGPLLAILGFSKKELTSSERKKMKGYANPYFAEPQSIRAKFPSINTILNTVHISDDFPSLIREALIFFSIDEIKSAYESAIKLKRGKPAEKEDSNAILKKIKLQEYVLPSINFFDTLYRIKNRVLSKLEETATAGKPEAVKLRNYLQLGLRLAEKEKHPLKVQHMLEELMGKELSEIKKILRKIHPVQVHFEDAGYAKQFAVLNKKTDLSQLAFVLYFLTDLEQEYRVNWGRIFQILKNNDVFFTEKERFVIESSMFTYIPKNLRNEAKKVLSRDYFYA